MNAFGLVDSLAVSPAIIRMLSQGTRSSRFWPLPDIRARGGELFGNVSGTLTRDWIQAGSLNRRVVDQTGGHIEDHYYEAVTAANRMHGYICR